MGKTKDYDDYIDYTYSRGIDPYDYDTYEDYIEAVLDEYPPINYNLWSKHSENLLEANLQDYFVETTVRREALAQPSGTVEIPDDPVERRKVRVKEQDKADRSAFLIKNQKGNLTKTDKKMISEIKERNVEGRKLTKTQQRYVKKSIMLHANILVRNYDYSKQRALKYAHKRFK